MATKLHPELMLQDELEPLTNQEAPGTRRWTLNRAGIINVYQYGNETLEFGGGRLLLRGVNGSGKSTAMNMLLPFLLDGQTRHIDAAGEQSGVLRGWMLSGREEPQPLGYLWLELVNDGSYLSFGCGIRANRSTDQVTTWWFITSRRPGVDLHLVEGRVPISRDALQAAIEPDVVYSQEQRVAYRKELRGQLFGGAEIEQHLNLLRIVRNPRVGDRLDADLPQYLHDALPQLSDAALEDAAQPLEDLEEHRRNVADLRATAEALGAMAVVYRNYARTELHRAADSTIGAVHACDHRRQQEEKALKAHHVATRRRERAEKLARRLEVDVERYQGEIGALEASDAYKSGAQLNDLRERVKDLARSEVAARRQLQRHGAATGRAAVAIQHARQEAQDDQSAFRQRLSNLTSLAAACHLTVRPPVIPSIAPVREPPDGPDLAPNPIDTAVDTESLSKLQVAARQRIGDVEAVEAAVRTIGPAEQALQDAERVAKDAETGYSEAQAELATARALFQSAIKQWHAAASRWIDRLRQHNDLHRLPPLAIPREFEDMATSVASGHSVAAPLHPLIDRVIRHHGHQLAHVEAMLTGQRKAVAALEDRAAELEGRQLPDPPAAPWQLRNRKCLGELVDFADDVSASARAGIEGALEAAGLLAAEVLGDGALRLAAGQLVIAPQAVNVPAPLCALLRADVREGDTTTHTAVERILRAISTEPTGNADTMVSIDGEFRIGTLRGKHVKREPEHIGMTARRAALERQRAALAQELTQARHERDRLSTDVQAAQAALDDAQALRGEIPAEQDLITALSRRGNTEDRVDKEEARLRERQAELKSAERRHGETVQRAHAIANRLSLPPSSDDLSAVCRDLDRIIADSREATSELKRLAKAIERWRDRGAEWREARAEEQTTEAYVGSASRHSSAAQTRLDTLEASIGAAYEEILATIERTRRSLEAAREQSEQIAQERMSATGDVSTTGERHRKAVEERRQTEEACVVSVAILQRVLTVPGLIEAASVGMPASGAAMDADIEPGPEKPGDGNLSNTTAGEFPLVEASPVGARRLVEAIRAKIARPEEAPTTAESVRQSIRRRRDTLGAGWDAEDRQPDEELPLRIEVTGPLAQQTPLPAATVIVQHQLTTMKSLLSAKQQQALRNLLQGLVAREVAEKLHAAGDLIKRMNQRLSTVKTTHGIGVELRWRRRDDLDPGFATTVGFLAKLPDLRTADEDRALVEALGQRIDEAHRDDPSTPYRELIARVLDYRDWHQMTIILHRAGRTERLGRRTHLSEGEKKVVSYLPLFAAVAASYDGLAEHAGDVPRFVLLDDAFAKVSTDNHAKLFGLLVELDLDFIATSERLWGTHETVPELAITEVIRDAELETIVLEHLRWTARHRELR